MTQFLECPAKAVAREAQQTASSIDLASVKARQQLMWASGDYSVIGVTLQIVGESLCEALDLEAGSRVLDVACGDGNASLAAARRWTRVTGLDYVAALLERAAARARAEQLELQLIEGDAELLPFDDASFDVALSTFGVMFAPDQVQAARELMRVVKPGGKIGLANWTPEGYVGRMLQTLGKHVPPPAGVASPSQWGREQHLRELFRGARSLRVEYRDFVFRYESVAHYIDVFRRFFGPTHKAFSALDEQGQARLSSDLAQLAAAFNRSSTTFQVPGQYLEVVIER